MAAPVPSRTALLGMFQLDHHKVREDRDKHDIHEGDQQHHMREAKQVHEHHDREADRKRADRQAQFDAAICILGARELIDGAKNMRQAITAEEQKQQRQTVHLKEVDRVATAGGNHVTEQMRAIPDVAHNKLYDDGCYYCEDTCLSHLFLL
jgi:hypothetical protein